MSAERKKLEDGSKIAIIGGGPAGTFSAFHIQKLAGELGRKLEINIFESRYFGNQGGNGCNKCGGVLADGFVSEARKDGLIFPENIIFKPIKSYKLHTNETSIDVNIGRETLSYSIYRGGGPKHSSGLEEKSFDNYLLNLALDNGANLIAERVINIIRNTNGKFQIITNSKIRNQEEYDLIITAVGLNSKLIHLPFFQKECNYEVPKSEKGYIHELKIGSHCVDKLGNTMHIFITQIPEIKLAAIVPKGEYATMVLIGNEVERSHVNEFLKLKSVDQLLPKNFEILTQKCCGCIPNVNVGPAKFIHSDGIAFVGDCLISRLYKDGIGTAYRISKALANTIMNDGIDANSLGSIFSPVHFFSLSTVPKG